MLIMTDLQGQVLLSDLSVLGGEKLITAEGAENAEKIRLYMLKSSVRDAS